MSLREQADRQTLERVVSDHVELSRWSTGVAKRAIAAWAPYCPTEWNLQVDNNGEIRIPVADNGGKQVISIELLLEAGHWLANLAACDGIEKFRQDFNNPTQFMSALFELECAHFCFSNPAVYKLQFEPTSTTRRRSKKPDFAIVEAGCEIICECKDMHSVDRAAETFGGTFRPVLTKEIERSGIPANLRVELEVRATPPGSREKLARRIVEQISTTPWAANGPHLVPDTNGKLSVSLVDKSRPLSAATGIVISSHGDSEPVGPVRQQDSSLIIYDQRDASTPTGDILNDANGQLSPDKWGIIFLRPRSIEDVQKALERRAHDPAYKTLLFVVIRGDNGWSVVGLRNHARPLAEVLMAGQ